jgi:general secretion pathway protein E
MLFTGPTGSGKTTSMYAALHELNTPQRKVMTVEDPVEYVFPGMVQVAINSRENTTFPSVLRACLRSDPDVMMVGEVRDRETIHLCAQSALTGHLVLTQLHTDEAVAALARLVDLGLDPFMVVDAVKLVVSQKLVRVLCKQCSVPTDPSADQLSEAARIAREGGLPWDSLPRHFRKAAGCKECGFTGYRGRLMVAEVLTMSPTLAGAVRTGANVTELRRIAVTQGMTTMTADALSRAAEGRVLLDEALRVLPD